MSEARAQAFAESVRDHAIGAMWIATALIGERTGLWQALADAPATSAQLAARTGLQERYVLEWLRGQVANGALEHDAASGRFTLPPEHATVLLDPDSPLYAGGLPRMATSFARVVPEVERAFREGGGVPYAAYGADGRSSIADANASGFRKRFAQEWVPALGSGVVDRLRAGGSALEMGCGVGNAAVALALAFPAASIVGVDLDAGSLDDAQRNAREAGVGDRVRFCRPDEAEGAHDLVYAFEMVHDCGDPVAVLRSMRACAAPGGAVLVGDDVGAEDLAGDVGPTGALLYGCSVLHCLPVSLAEPGGAGTGTCMRESTFRGYAADAGFGAVDVLPIDHDYWRFYRLR